MPFPPIYGLEWPRGPVKLEPLSDPPWTTPPLLFGRVPKQGMSRTQDLAEV